MAEWESQLKKLKTTSDGKIIKPLRISYDGLDDTQKALFLDISCFFIGKDKDYVAKMLDVCGFFATIGISVLRERCLVTVKYNKLNMHDLIREMAKVIISEKSPCHLGKWSRLWNRQEVADVLRNTYGTKKVEGLALNFNYLWHQNYSMPCFSTEAFAKMKKLRLLHLKYVELNGEYKHLPKELKWLSWRKFPLKSIPDAFFNQDKLVILDMRRSKLVQVWEGSKSLQNLKIINLSFYLIKSPDFSQVPNLEQLILERCMWLSEIHPSIGHLKRLSLVNLKWCGHLISLPGDFYKSKSVETLLLTGCFKLRELHEDLGKMISLRILEAENTSIRQVPASRSFDGLYLRELSLRCCSSNDAILKLGSLISLQYLHLQSYNFHVLPSLSGLSKLETLHLNYCKNLHTISDLPTNLKFFIARGCFALETMPDLSEMPNMRKLDVMNSPKLTANFKNIPQDEDEVEESCTDEDEDEELGVRQDSHQPHAHPQTHPENLPVLFQPQGPAVNDRGDQISDPMDEDPLSHLSLSLDHSLSTCSDNVRLRSDGFLNRKSSKFSPLSNILPSSALRLMCPEAESARQG
ncbi:hypothetical protein COP2_026856 [Malus domestica]